MKQRYFFYYLGAICLISAIIFIAYNSSLSNGFIFNWDDGAYVIRNKNIHNITLENIWWMFTAFHAANWHPLTWFSHAIDYALFGENPWGHHLTNIIFHAFNSGWVFLLSFVLIYIEEKPLNEPFKLEAIFEFKRFFIALLTAILFAIHPQHVESVAWIAERKDVLFFFFFIPSLLSYAIYTQIQKKSWYIASLIFFTLSLLSKPMAVTLPIILILFDIYPLQQINLKSIKYKKWLVNKIPFLLIAFTTGIFTLLAQTDVGAVASTQQVEIQIRFLNAFNSIIVYFEKWLLPLHLSPFYSLEIEYFKHLTVKNISNIIVILIITVIAIYFWIKSQRVWLVSWLFYLITLLPVLGLIQVGSQGMADRYAYLTTLPFYLLLSIGLVQLYLKYSKIISILLVIIINILLINLTFNQIKIWQNDLTLWDYAVRSDPDSSFAQKVLGNIYMHINKYEQAAKHFEIYVSLAASNNPLPHYDLGQAYFKLGRLDDALKEFQSALTINQVEKTVTNAYFPADIYFDMARTYLLKGNISQAQFALEQALIFVPDHADALALKKNLQK
jgi:protein O-mannosyl-transferase